MSRFRRSLSAVIALPVVVAAALAAVFAIGRSSPPAAAAEPTVSPAAALRATIVSRPQTFVEGPTSVTLTREQLRLLVTVSGARVVVDAAWLEALLAEAFPPRPPRSAMLRTDAKRAWVVPSENGRRLDADATGLLLIRAPRSTTHAVLFDVVPPKVSTADVEALGIRDVVSEFTTRYEPGQPRVTNIKRAAALLDGTRLAPGQRFSMNEALGERTTAKGFVPAPQILGNQFVDSVGGGISQVATTLFNAAFFAGLRLDEHRAHSIYIDRYPLGREATISWGGPELIFTNDWDASLLMRLIATDTEITVRFYSTSFGRRVATQTTVDEPIGSGLVVRYTRRVFQNERLVRDEVFTTRYTG